MDNIELLDQKEKKMLVKEGQALLKLIISKGYTPYSFSKKAMYSNSRLYKIIRGECDITSIKVYNAFIFSKLLGYEKIDDMYDALGIDVLKDLN